MRLLLQKTSYCFRARPQGQGTGWCAVFTAAHGPAFVALYQVLSIDVRVPLATRVIEPDGLEVREEVRSLFGHLLLPHAGRLDAAERELRLAANGRLIHVDHADFRLLHETHRLEIVARVDRCGEAERDVVREPHCLLQITRVLDGEDRTEHFVAGEPRPGLHGVEDRGRDE